MQHAPILSILHSNRAQYWERLCEREMEWKKAGANKMLRKVNCIAGASTAVLKNRAKRLLDIFNSNVERTS